MASEHCKHGWIEGRRGCLKPRTHKVVTYSPTGLSIDRGRYCEPHATRLAAQFVQTQGWDTRAAQI